MKSIYSSLLFQALCDEFDSFGTQDLHIMKLEWRPSLEGAEVRKSLFDASFGFFYARAGLAKS